MDYDSKIAPARLYALVFGITYLLVALAEVLFDVVEAGGVTILHHTVIQNAVHWLVGAVVLASYFASALVAKRVAQVIAVVFILLSIVGLVARTWTGEILGYEGPLPWVYNIVHIVTAIAASLAGFMDYDEHRTHTT